MCETEQKHGQDFSTSTDEADGAKESSLGVVHLEWEELAGEGKHEVSEGAEPGVMHLCPVECQTIREGHGVLLRSVPCTDPQHLRRRNDSLDNKL